MKLFRVLGPDVTPEQEDEILSILFDAVGKVHVWTNPNSTLLFQGLATYPNGSQGWFKPNNTWIHVAYLTEYGTDGTMLHSVFVNGVCKITLNYHRKALSEEAIQAYYNEGGK